MKVHIIYFTSLIFRLFEIGFLGLGLLLGLRLGLGLGLEVKILVNIKIQKVQKNRNNP
jgi:hypothetical protein